MPAEPINRSGRPSPSGVEQGSRHGVVESAFSENYADLLRKAERIVGPSDAPDIVMDAIVKSFPGLTTADDPGAYLKKVVETCSIDELRKRSVWRKYGTNVNEDSDASSAYGARSIFTGGTSHLDPDRQVQARVVLERVLGGLEDLSEQQLSILRLRVAGLSEVEIAKELNIPRGVVKKQGNRTRTKLARYLEGFEV